MNAILAAGYGYEVLGLVFYIFYLSMTRGANKARFTLRSRVLVIVAAFVLVACVPFHYATNTSGVAAMMVLSVIALGSVFIDARKPLAR
jgi:hypothetical protein